MKIFFPNNIFTKLIADALPIELKDNLSLISSALISKEINESEDAIGLIPTMDLLSSKDFFVSRKFGIAFDSSLCNSFLYFNKDAADFNSINLFGDVSSVEVILTKILFKELYNTDVDIQIITDGERIKNQNLLVIGDLNYRDAKFLRGLSFSEEIIEVISLPYVNFVLASKNKENIEAFHKFSKQISPFVYNRVESETFHTNFSAASDDFIRKSISSVILDFEQQDVDGIEQLIRLPYFHGIIKDIIVLNFV